MQFSGRMAALTMAEGAVVRITPDHHSGGRPLAAVKIDATAREETLTAKLAMTNADAVTIQARLDALQNDMTTMRARSWLRRLIG